MILRYEMSTAAKKRNGGAVGTRHATRSAQEARALVVERPARKTPRCLLLAHSCHRLHAAGTEATET
jgi:hypothetical protein